MSELRTEFERLHPVPKNVVWLPSNEMYWTFTEFGETDIAAMKEQNSLWQGFQSGHAAGLEQQAKRIAELEASLADSNEALQALGLKLVQAEADIARLKTPAAKWREAGQPDPHGDYYDCERAKLCMGHLTDDELANEVFMKSGIGELTAAKERIRWLSRLVVKLQSHSASTTGGSVMDIEELKRLYEFRDQAYMDGVAWRDAIAAAFPAIVAKLEAAQRLRDAVRPFCKIAESTVGRIPTERLSGSNWHELWKAAKAFDADRP